MRSTVSDPGDSGGRSSLFDDDDSQESEQPDESDTYALSTGDHAMPGPEDENQGSSEFGIVPPPPMKKRRRKPEPEKQISLWGSDSDGADGPSPWWHGVLKAIGIVVGLQVIGILLSLIFPSLILPMLGAYILGLVILVGMAWFLGLQHAFKHNAHSVIFFFLIPLYPVRYGMRHWPETKPSVMAVGLLLVWLTAPFFISLPITLVGGLFANRAPVVAEEQQVEPAPQKLPPAEPAPVPVAGNMPTGFQPAKENLPPGGTPNPAPSGNQQASLNPPSTGTFQSVSTRIGPDGTMTITVTNGDGTVTTTVRQSKSNVLPTSEESRQRFDLMRKLNDRSNHEGMTFIAEVRGTDRELVFGGLDGIYTLNSSPSAAAVHAGLVKIDETARIKITLVPSEPKYPSIEQNGILSLAATNNYQLSYKIETTTDPLPGASKDEEQQEDTPQSRAKSLRDRHRERMGRAMERSTDRFPSNRPGGPPPPIPRSSRPK